MIPSKHQKLTSYFIALVWFINGLFCKVMDMVPRHEQIVGRILGEEYSRELTVLIGILEILMSIWVLSSYKRRIVSVLQIVLVLAMNTIEFFLVPDLLLWGRYNFVFAAAFALLIYHNEFNLSAQIKRKEEVC